jgi:hypothetical protein
LLSSAITIAACGGGGGGGGASATASGGGGSAPPFVDPDGLGLSGQVAGTMVTAMTSDMASYLPAVTLDDLGRGLVVWFDTRIAVDHPRPTLWQRSDAARQWSPLEELGPPVPSFTLRGNAAGDAVLGVGVSSSFTLPTSSPVPSVRRHTHAAGWTAPFDVPDSTQLDFDKSSDLALLDDGSIVLSRVGPATSNSGAKTDSFRILRHREPVGWETFLETPASFSEDRFQQRSYLAANANGTAMFYWMHTETPQGFNEPVHTLNLQFVDLKQSVALGVLPFLAGQYRPCHPISPVTAADSPRFKVLALVHRGQPSPDTLCDLDLIRVDFGGPISIRTDRLNPTGTIMAGQPSVVMSRQGDAIVIWQQLEPTAGRPGFFSTTLVWSQSLQGGPWSAPQPVLPPTAGVGEIIDFQKNFTFVANDNGQVVGVLQTVRNGRQYLVTGRFSVATGWTWQLAANMISMGASGAGVAINSAGEALLVYFARPCQRSSSSFQFEPTTCRPTETYALRF